ncbi:InlB B-repeat-containing protein, partial [Fibrobacter intestinalis]
SSTNTGAVSTSTSYSYSDSYSGGFVGYASSNSTVTISSSQNSGNITGTVSTSSSKTNLYSYVGGFIGWSYKGQILDSYNTGSVRAKDTSAVSPNSSYRHLLYAGGLAGYLDSGMTIKNAYSATDSVSYSFITSNSYTVGYAGALVGLSKGSLQNVYFDSDSLSLAAIGSDSSASKINVGGFSTANMQRDLFAWQLNSTGGTEENSKIWSRNGGYPIFADAQNKAIYKVVFDDEGATTNRYSNNKGVIKFPEAPEPASGYVFVAWLDSSGNVFSEKSTLSCDKKVSAYYALESDSLYIVDFMDTEGNLWASRPTNAAGGLDSVPEPPAPDSGFYFIGWFDSLDSRVEPTTVFTGNTTLSAKYSELTIVFLNADGDTLQNSVAKYGSIPKYMGKTPTKASTTEYDYTFYGWNPNLATATEPATYTAVFDSSLKTFMVTFRNGFTTLQSTKVGYGATPAYNGNTPTKPSSTQYDYTFKGWSPSIVPVTGNAIYTAVFDSTAISQGSSSSVAQSSSSAIASSSSAMQSSSSMIASSSSVSSSSFGIMSSSSAVVQSSSSAVQSSSSVIASSSSEAPSSSSGVSSSSSSEDPDALHFSAHPRFNLHVQNRTLQIQNARIGSAFAVLDLQGRVLRRGVVNSSEFSMELQNAGAYIVRVGSQVQKIRVK